MSPPAIAVSESAFALLSQHAAKRGIALRFARLGAGGVPLDDMADVQAVLATGLGGPTLRRLLRDYPAIRWVSAQNAGVDAVLVPEVTERRLTVTRVRHVHDTYVAEFAMAAILAAGKRLPDIVRASDRQQWLEFQPPLLRGQTVAMIGYGEIGRAVAKRAKGFDMRVIGVRAHPKPDDVADEVWGIERLTDALAQADYAILAVPGGGDRRHLIGEPQLRLLRQEAYVINVGRGETVDEAALDRVLGDDGFAGAILDVFEVEPLPKDSPLWSNPRVIISGHLAGIRGKSVDDDVLDQLVDNMARFSRGEPLLNTVDVEQGY